MANSPTLLPNGNYSYTNDKGITTQGTKEAVLSRYTAENPPAPPAPAPTTGVTTPPVSRYTSAESALYAPGGVHADQTIYTDDQKQAIRDQERAKVQAQIDAINEMSNQELASAYQRGAQRSGQTRALLSNTGQVGAPSGDTIAKNTEDVNTAEQNAIRAAAQEKVQAILSGVQTRADSIIDKQKTDATSNADAYVSFLKDQSTQAKQDLKDLASAGATLSPAQRKQLIDQTGYDESNFDQIYSALEVANKPKTDIIGDPVKSGSKLIYTVRDPNSANGIKTITLDAGVNLEKGDYSITSDSNGVYILNKADGSYKRVGGGTGSGTGTDQLYAGLSTPTSTAVRAKVAKFSGEPSVTNFSTVQDGYNFSSSLATDTKNPADDQALIYSLAKALDPGSVVREGEYATAQKYAQSWIDAYGKGVSQALLGTGFLSQTARENIKKVIKQKYDTQKMSYDQAVKSYTTGINALTGRSDGSKFLIDYVTPEQEKSVKDRAAAAGYDYQAMVNAGYDDSAIIAALEKVGQ